MLGWHENNLKEDIPPEHIWEDNEGLEEWWERVKERHERRAGGGPPSAGAGADDSEEMASNEFARALKE